MRILILPIGIPGSGKTTLMKSISERYNIPRVESDYVREELYGDASIQGDFHEVFDEVYRQINLFLNEMNICILDATNVTHQARRRAIFRTHPDQIIYVIMDNDYDKCASRNQQRDRVVPKHVMRRMWKNLVKDFPVESEIENLIIYNYDSPQLFLKLEEVTNVASV